MKDNLRIIVMNNCKELGDSIDKYLMKLRNNKVSYVVPSVETRFNDGHGKLQILSSVREKDLYIISDIGNPSCTYEMYGHTNYMGPDEHFTDIKRVIGASMGHTRDITVIMPLLYSSRQHRVKSRESLDAPVALQELKTAGVKRIVTFDVHDIGVRNAIPYTEFQNIYPTNSILNSFIDNEHFDYNNLLFISPDTGAIDRAKYYANVFKCNIGAFYKTRDLTKPVNGKYPITGHIYMGPDIKDKNVVIVDDMIASGESILDTALKTKELGAKNVYIVASFALFTAGLDLFREYYKKEIFNKLYSTNLTYVYPEERKEEWFECVDCSNQVAQVINVLNKDESLSPLLSPDPNVLQKVLDNKRYYKS